MQTMFSNDFLSLIHQIRFLGNLYKKFKRLSLAGGDGCAGRCHQRVLVERWGEEDATLDALLGDDSDAANAAGASVVEHRVENSLLDELDAVLLLHLLLVVLADEAVDERAARAADCAALTDHHAA